MRDEDDREIDRLREHCARENKGVSEGPYYVDEDAGLVMAPDEDDDEELDEVEIVTRLNDLTSKLAEADFENDRMTDRLTEARAEVEKWKRIRENTHGSCCQCQRCGLDYDECRCSIDSIADDLTEARAEIDELKGRAAAARSQLDKANDMVVYLLKMLPWGAASGALYEDPVVKAAIRSVAAHVGVK